MQQLMIENGGFTPPPRDLYAQKPQVRKAGHGGYGGETEFATFEVKTPLLDSGETLLDKAFYRVEIRRYGESLWEWKPAKPLSVGDLAWREFERDSLRGVPELSEVCAGIQEARQEDLKAAERNAAHDAEIKAGKIYCTDSEVTVQYVYPDDGAYTPHLRDYSEPPATPQEAEKVTTVVVRKCFYNDGSTREFLLGIENPGAVYVHKYRDNLYKVCTFVMPLAPRSDGEKGKPKEEMPYDERFQNNLVRARTSIEEYGLCNPWRWFVTFTLDAEKKDRTDLENFRKKLNQMIRNLRRNTGQAVDFLLVPELHPTALESGKIEWHMHGLMNIPESWLEMFVDKAIYGKDKNKRPPLYIQKMLRKGILVYHWKHYDNSFGGNVIEPVLDRDRATRYLLKYVSKEQAKTAAHLEKGQHLYFASRGLKKSEKVDVQCLQDIARQAKKNFVKPGEHCVIRWISL